MTAAARIAVGSDLDHPTARAVVDGLERAGHVVVRCGALDPDAVAAWPAVAEQVARLVAAGTVRDGVVCCWTGTGVSIAANKVPGVRAALCGDAATAIGARRWNDANVLALSLRATSAAVAAEVVEAWLGGAAIDPAEIENIQAVTAIERRYHTRASAAAPSTE